MKKAQGLSMSVIVVAAIALLVLVILAIIFIGRMGNTASQVDACKGTCVDDEEACQERGSYYRATSDPCYDLGESEPNDKVCCIGVN